MKLIDADKVKQYILTEGFYCDTEADREATVEKIENLFPTVDAIPIEWIEKYIEDHTQYMVAPKYEDTNFTEPPIDYYTKLWPFQVAKMLERWGKENEQKTSD